MVVLRYIGRKARYRDRQYTGLDWEPGEVKEVHNEGPAREAVRRHPDVFEEVEGGTTVPPGGTQSVVDPDEALRGRTIVAENGVEIALENATKKTLVDYLKRVYGTQASMQRQTVGEIRQNVVKLQDTENMVKSMGLQITPRDGGVGEETDEGGDDDNDPNPLDDV